MRVWADGVKPPKTGHWQWDIYHDWAKSMSTATAVLQSGKVSFLSVGWFFNDGKTGLDLLKWLAANAEAWPCGGVAIHYAPKEIRPAMEEIIRSRYRKVFRP